jgi:hypothetical protein
MIFRIVRSLFLSAALALLVVGSARATDPSILAPIPLPPIVPIHVPPPPNPIVPISPPRAVAPEFDPRLLAGSVAILAGVLLLARHRRGKLKA